MLQKMLIPLKQAILLIALFVAFRSIDANVNNTGIVHRVERHSNSYVRGCYFTNWAQYRPGIGKYVPEDYIPGLCTNIFYAFGWMNDDFTVRAYDETDLPTSWAGEGNYARVNALKKTDPGLKTSLSFGGWTFGPAPFQRMTKTRANREIFINSAIAFVRKYNFDGIDIDWEYPAGQQDKDNFSAFLKELLAAAEAEAAKSGLERLLLTAAVAAGKSNINNGYDVPVIAQYLDYILLMSYDFHGAWESETGENSPLYARSDATGYQKTLNTNWAANYWASKGMPRNKIIVGIAAYGRGWTLSNPANHGLGAPGTASKPTPYVREAGIASYYELCDMVSSGAQRFWDEEQKVPYLVQGNQWFGYDDVESVTIKMHYIIDEGFGGAFAWTLALDDFRGQCPDDNGVRYPLISLFGKILGGDVVPTVQPTTKTSTQKTTRPSTQAPSTASTSQPGEFRCTSDGFFPDPTDPHRFYRCVFGTAYSFTCPGDTTYNPEVETCVYAD